MLLNASGKKSSQGAGSAACLMRRADVQLGLCCEPDARDIAYIGYGMQLKTSPFLSPRDGPPVECTWAYERWIQTQAFM